GEFADQLARAEHRQHVLPAVGGGAVELHLALGHHVQPVSGVALVEERVASGERRLGHGSTQLSGLLPVERREERGAPQNVVHEFSPCRAAHGAVPSMMPDGKTVRSITSLTYRGSAWAPGVRLGC